MLLMLAVVVVVVKVVALVIVSVVVRHGSRRNVRRVISSVDCQLFQLILRNLEEKQDIGYFFY